MFRLAGVTAGERDVEREMNFFKSPEGGERRHFSRVDFKHAITLHVDGDETPYPGGFDDVSLKGMLFYGEALPPEGTMISGLMDLGGVPLLLKGKVLRASEERGAAIVFQEMDVESFTHLRRLVSLNAGDAELIDRELFDSI